MMKQDFSANASHLCLASAVFLGVNVSGALADEFNAYHYKLDAVGNTDVCKHMQGVYDRYFRQPWGAVTEIPVRVPSFPRLPGVEYDERMALDLRYSAFPTSPEFDAIQWREGRYKWDEKGNRLAPLLAAELDIDNDGQRDIVVKISFMLGFRPGGQGAPGGEDQLFVFDKDHLDLAGGATSVVFYGHPGKKRPARIAYDTLGLSARLIRPFKYDGVTYLSVYEQYALDDPKRGRETMWVLKYRGGGGNLGGGKWEPVRANHVCRFRMIVAK